jgi:hypothetical protein
MEFCSSVMSSSLQSSQPSPLQITASEYRRENIWLCLFNNSVRYGDVLFIYIFTSIFQHMFLPNYIL